MVFSATIGSRSGQLSVPKSGCVGEAGETGAPEARKVVAECAVDEDQSRRVQQRQTGQDRFGFVAR